ncbi:relaxase domain-containing protein [Tolypothrix sp. PCC 7910]|uniref:MobF family relaxase n=1 Tax=Tolypothrix sp. PCC 7910 TaxID=2099387 RepID=UPI0014276F29|nr:MobF family relaxase [Tolypothrix sp. PCC 7910]QIR36842.1 relaxase domain-containing protein [Tolypothrix sp. PCC 7910]
MVLSVSIGSHGSAAAAYYATQDALYEITEQEQDAATLTNATKRTACGYYFGRGAAALGIEGDKIYPNDTQFATLMQGKTPDKSAFLRKGVGTVRKYTNKATGEVRHHSSLSHYDLTFSAPKEVSLLMAVSPDQETRDRFYQYHINAVHTALHYIESQCITRVGSAGKDTAHVDVIVAVFHHTTSRANDPQLHTHAILINGGLRSDGVWGALDSKMLLKKDAPVRLIAGQLYQNTLRTQLEQAETLTTYDRPFSEGKGVSFGIEGITPAQRDAFSSRHQQIVEGLTSSDSGKEVQITAVTTRPPKDHKIVGEALLNEWQHRAQAVDLSWERIVSSTPRVEQSERMSAQHTRAATTTSQRHTPKVVATTSFQTPTFTTPPTPTPNSTHAPSQHLNPTSSAREISPLHRTMATYLQQYQPRGGFTRSHIVFAAIQSPKVAINTALKAAQTFEAKYTRPTRHAGILRLSRVGHRLVNWQSIKEKLVSFGHTLLHYRNTIRWAALYATGRITRKQYLLGREHHHIARLRYERKITHTTYQRYLEALRRDRNIPRSIFIIRAKQATGAMPKKRADYWVKYAQSLKGKTRPQPLTKKERRELLAIKPNWGWTPKITSPSQKISKKEDRARLRLY